MLGAKSGFRQKLKNWLQKPKASTTWFINILYQQDSFWPPEGSTEFFDQKCKLHQSRATQNSPIQRILQRNECWSWGSSLLYYCTLFAESKYCKSFCWAKRWNQTIPSRTKKDSLFTYFDDNDWTVRVAYLTDIFHQLNKVNLKLLEKETNILKFQDCLQALMCKLQNWRKKVNLENVAMFEKLFNVIDESESGLNQLPKDELFQHLKILVEEMQQYFPELIGDEEALL